MSQINSTKEVLQIGREYPQPGEEQIARDIVNLLQNQVLRFYDTSKTKLLRQIHPKMNGCVKAEFIIEPNLPQELRAGLFKDPVSFPAWVRFSNGETKPVPDYKKDIRGFAIKIMNVPGKKLDDNETGTGNHDFILMNTKAFASGNIKKFADVLFFVTTPFKWSTLFKKAKIILSNIPIIIRGKIKAPIKINHPCEIPYFSTVPYRFGDETRAVKYAVFPSPLNKLEITETESENFLRKNLAATLLKNEILFDFKVQFQTDAEKMPVEDPTVEWDSAFVKLATIRIPTQVFDTKEQSDFGDNLSFSSWHCLPEHQPIGNFNRVRKIIYEEMYTFRHQQNNIAVTEPAAGPGFFSNTNI